MTEAGVPWGAILGAISILFTLLGLAIAYGKHQQSADRSTKDIDGIRADHEVARRDLEARILDVRKLAEQAREDMSGHRLHVSETFVRKTDLGAMEDRLGTRFDELKADFYGKVDEIKADFGKRSIEHAIKNAIATALAPDQIAQIRGRRT